MSTLHDAFNAQDSKIGITLRKIFLKTVSYYVYLPYT